ncbi:MAG: tyrosine--tRNA ligase [Candidatus Paceibacterota bacterium]|jgi:tyrosyl-tRNA synthetase
MADLEKSINELLTRGVVAIYPSKEFLESKLKSGEKLTIYHGVDPTGPTLHVGHSVPLFKLAQFQQLGHQIIFLIGDMTATIGDPTDKTAARVPLTREEVLENSKLYKKQASKIIKFSGENPAKLRYNSKWLARMTLADTFKVYSNMTYAQTIKRDMFQKRIAEGKDLYLHEFMYPMMQGYDSVALDVDGEIGGSDQTFNMLVGRDLMKKLKNKEKFVVCTKLLVDASGKKMGKTEGNMVALDEDANQMFGKVMSWADGLILSGFELCTRLPMEKIQEIKSKLDGGMNPRDAKFILAEEITAIYHSQKKAREAKKNFLAVFSDKSRMGEVKEAKAEMGELLIDIVSREKLVSSKSDFRRLIVEGAVSNAETKEKITDPFFKITSNLIIRIGPLRFLKIKI